MSTPTLYIVGACGAWEDGTAREMTGVHPPSYAEAKKVKSLAIHIHGCPWAIA